MVFPEASPTGKRATYERVETVTGTGEPPRTDYTKQRHLVPPIPELAAEQADCIKREAARVPQPTAPPPPTRIKRLLVLVGPKCKSCGERGTFEKVSPWRAGYVTFRCRHCLEWRQQASPGGT